MRHGAFRSFMIGGAIAIMLATCESREFMVKGRSMDPTYKHGAIIEVSRDKDKLKIVHLRRGDVVVVESPVDGTSLWLLRILGLPGETLVLEQRRLLIDGKTLSLGDVGVPEQQYELGERIDARLKDDEFFLVGDNLDVARDSREFGAFLHNRIKGLVE